MADRADLINQLAASMGAGQFAQTRYEQSKFDSDTGIFYSNGVMISASVAEKALKHFEMLKSKCNLDDPASHEMAMIYQCAIEAIKAMQDPVVKNLMKSELAKKLA